MTLQHYYIEVFRFKRNEKKLSSVINKIFFKIKKIYNNFLMEKVISTQKTDVKVYRIYGDCIETLEPLDYNSMKGDESIKSLSNSLIQSGGYVKVDDKIYDLRREGIYRFYKLPNFFEQRIVYNGKLNSILNMIGYLWSYGLVDEKKEIRKILSNSILKGIPILGCSNCAFLATEILKFLGHKARVVAIYTNEHRSGYDDGHTLVEVLSDDSLPYKEKGKWFLYDPSFNRLFFCKDTALSLIEAIESAKIKKIRFVKLPGNFGHSVWRTKKYDFGFWVDHRMLCENELSKWYLRMLQIGLIYKEGLFYFDKEYVINELPPIMKKMYIPMERLEFRKNFYEYLEEGLYA